MKKMLKKISKIILLILLILSMNLLIVMNSVQATTLTTATVYEIDYCEKVLKYQGIPRGSVYVVYKEAGVEYPAYCINPEKIGVGETDSYNVSINGYIQDIMLWRILINGYPYKSVADLGVANEKEAYLATKQAIYCYLDNRNVNEYSGIGEAGERTLNALKQIWNNAQNSTNTQIANVIDIVEVTSEWEQDNIDSEYISKTYKVEAPAPTVGYWIEVEGKNIPDGLMIADEKNDETQMFNTSQEFKILIPIAELEKGGSFEINATTNMDTKAVFLGVSPNEDWQNYALTAFDYEESEGAYYEEYPKNEAQIKILKQEKDTEKPLEGVEFQLLNSEKEVILQNLITDKNGEIILENVVPGTYYLGETKTLTGYVLYDEDIEIEVQLDEQVNVIVNNAKEKIIEISKDVTNIIVEKIEENIQENITEKNIQKLPKTGM